MDKRKSKAESLYLQNKEELLEEENKGTAVFWEGPYYAQIPEDLVRDSKIPHAAVRLYGIYHTFAQSKRLMSNPRTFVSQETIAKCMGVNYVRVSIWTKHLEDTGWLAINRRGQGKSNIIILHSRKRSCRKK